MAGREEHAKGCGSSTSTRASEPPECPAPACTQPPGPGAAEGALLEPGPKDPEGPRLRLGAHPGLSLPPGPAGLGLVGSGQGRAGGPCPLTYWAELPPRGHGHAPSGPQDGLRQGGQAPLVWLKVDDQGRTCPGDGQGWVPGAERPAPQCASAAGQGFPEDPFSQVSAPEGPTGQLLGLGLPVTCCPKAPRPAHPAPTRTWTDPEELRLRVRGREPPASARPACPIPV